MKTPATILCLFLFAGALAGCGASNGGSADAQPDYFNPGACSNSDMGPGYSRDYSYGDRYVQGQSRRC